MADWTSRFKARWKARGHIIKSRPHVILVPLALMALMMGLGIWAVMAGAAHQENSERTKATSHVEAAASTLQLSIERAMMPATQLADWVKHTRNYSTIQAEWDIRAADWYKRVPQSSMGLALAPFGHLNQIYPPTPGNQGVLDWDLLGGPPYRGAVLSSIANGDITLSEPVASGPFYLMTFQVPILIQNVSESETWGIPFNATDCPVGLCYNATTRTRWWGNSGMTVNVSPFIRSGGPLASLLQAGYKVQIWRPPNPLLNETQRVVVSEEAAVPQPPNAIRGLVPIANTQWEVYVWVDSWEPSWKVPLIAAVVVASIICACLIFAMLLSWEENRLLLHSILPEATIDRMKTDMEWKQTSHCIDNLRLVEIETPAQHMQSIIQAILAGEAPPMAMVVAVQRALKRSADVYSPASQDLRLKLDAGNLDSEVQRALVRQLAGRDDSSALETHDDLDLEAVSICNLEQSLASSPDIVVDKESGADVSGSHAVTRTSRTSKPNDLPKSPRTPTFNKLSCVTTSVPTTPDLRAALAALVASPNSAQAATITDTAGTTPGGRAHGQRGDDDLILSVEGSEAVSSAAAATLLAFKPVGAPEKPIMEQLDRVLSTANSWAFDAFELEEVTQGHSLSVLGYWLMHNSGCMEFARMDGAVLSRFLRRMEDGYKSNPYHNSRHAADVLQTFHVILHQGGLIPGYCDQLTLLGCYLAAILHDYEHRGFSNDYLINTNDELAVRYNDRSPMENHHLAAAWGLLNQPGFNCLRGLSKGSWDKLRKLVIELVLATDMRQHFAILGQFSTLHNTTGAAGTSLDAKSSCGGTSRGSFDLNTSSAQILVPSGDHDKLLSLQVALKCADVGHLAAPLPVHVRWVTKLEEEFFLQGDAERAKGMPISPLCDRTKEGVTKSQVGFFDFVVLPLYSNFAQKFKASRPLLNAVVTNYRYWQGKSTQSSHA